jgi:hypothetical protein
MADKVLRDFHERVARIERAHARASGFGAQGAPGRSHRTRWGRWRVPVIGPVLVLVLGVILLKAVIQAGLGTQDYAARVAALWEGGAVERIGAVVMQPDLASAWLAGQFAAMVRKAASAGVGR